MVTVEFAGELRRPLVVLHETKGEAVTEVRLGKVMRGKETRVARVSWFHRNTGKMATGRRRSGEKSDGLGAWIVVGV